VSLRKSLVEVHSDDESAVNSRPSPFFLAQPLETEPEDIGTPGNWQVERKWDGIRGQIIVRQNEIFVWSRGDELITDRFPEYQALASILPHGTVIDGEILPWKDGKPLPFALLQTRIGRKKVTKLLMEKAPVIFMAYDLLEVGGDDIRSRPMSERRGELEGLIANVGSNSILQLSPVLDGMGWDQLREERACSRELRTEGLMIKRKDSPYRVGRKKGDWWKWKVDPLTIDAVMIYALQCAVMDAGPISTRTIRLVSGKIKI
jgi:DNA ligase-1